MTSLHQYDAVERLRLLREYLAGLVVASLDEAFAAPRGFYVYCLWGDDAERPLYVGKSANIFSRLAQHATNAKGDGYTHGYDSGGVRRKTQVTRVTLLKCETREAMDRLEVELISRFRPDHNHAQKTRRRLVDVPGLDMPDVPPPPPEAPEDH